MKCQVDAIPWSPQAIAIQLGGGSRFSGGGGVVAEIFSDLRKPSRFSGGG